MGTGTTRLQDTFATGGRGSPNVWSPASSGLNWSHPNGTATLGFTGSQGTLSGDTSKNVMLLGSTILQDADITCHLSSTSPNDVLGPVGRYNSNGGTNYYRATYQNGTLFLQKVVLGGPTTIASIAVPPASAGYYVRLQITSVPVNNLKVSYWRDGETDPALAGSWWITATDSTQQLLVPGQCGVYGNANAAGDTMNYDSFIVADPNAWPSPPSSVPDLPYVMTLQVPSNNTPFLSWQTMQDLMGWGVGVYLRYQLHWKVVEPNADGNYNWSYSDYAVSLCNAFGIRILWPLQDPPTPYRTISPTDGSTQPPASGNYGNPTAWRTFASAVANRYNGTVASPWTGRPMYLDAIQLENEDYDSSSHTPRDIQSQWLVPVAQTCYPAIKAVHPQCKVGLCAVRKTTTSALSHIQNWMTNLYTYSGGIGGNADWLDFHYYRDGSSAGLDPNTQDSNTPSVATELATILAIIAQYGQHQQVWCCEYGWNTVNANTDQYGNSSQLVSQAVQAQYNQEMMDAMRLGGGSKVGIFTMDPTAQESIVSLPPAQGQNPVPTTVSTVQKSISQVVNNAYTYLLAYSAMATYIASYPAWSSASGGSGSMVEAFSRDGIIEASSRDGYVVSTSRDGYVVATSRGGY